MIQFTKWTIAFMINYLIVTILFQIFNPETVIIYIVVLLIDVIILSIMRLWTFIHWNIKSDEELGIKPGIELF